jgi:hypothetical protein
MNFKIIFRNSCIGLVIINKSAFDYQIFRIIDCHQKQPDLKKMVRLFFKSVPSWSGPFMNMKKLFSIFHFIEHEALLGSNRRKYEIRLSFHRTDEFPQGVILCFAISYFGIIGYFQSLYFRFIFYLLLPSVVESMGNYLN